MSSSSWNDYFARIQVQVPDQKFLTTLLYNAVAESERKSTIIRQVQAEVVETVSGAVTGIVLEVVEATSEVIETTSEEEETLLGR
eukprot:TRINITY_DN11050_c0_g1_i1.p1 TRINITY_DN11050_c0_g1~~TRINITY_DN11050_c0_g1_i1.p1  ORF type:complete len:85 (-),score=8.52 TRINITY_DN11050_c0_g1_i1:258-512(-)